MVPGDAGGGEHVSIRGMSASAPLLYPQPRHSWVTSPVRSASHPENLPVLSLQRLLEAFQKAELTGGSESKQDSRWGEGNSLLEAGCWAAERAVPQESALVVGSPEKTDAASEPRGGPASLADPLLWVPEAFPRPGDRHGAQPPSQSTSLHRSAHPAQEELL